MKFGIGQAVTRIEDERLLTGRGRYADDIDLPGALHLPASACAGDVNRYRGIDRR
jgi:CO/xanthine dehydrogenase Mo-binding subunit